MIQVIVRAIDILEFVASHGNTPVQLIKIAENSGLSQPTCANIVKTLVDKNYLENVSRKEGYILGINAFRLTGNIAYNQSLVAASVEPMQDLVREVNETCLLGILKNNKRFVINEVQANNDLQARTKPEADIYPTASGRMLLASLPIKEMNRIIDTIGLPENGVWPGIKSRVALVKALEKIKKDQWVETLSHNHIVGMAIPVIRKGQVIAALSVYLPQSRCTISHKKNILAIMRSTATKIKQQIDKE